MRRLVGALWRCTDTMPSDLRAEVDERVHLLGDGRCWTYAQAAQALRRLGLA